MLRTLNSKIVVISILMASSISFAGYRIFRSTATAPGSFLSNGMQLTYSSNGQESPPWIVAFVEKNLDIDGMNNCAKIGISYKEGTPVAARTECTLANGYLMVNEGTSWRQSRPVGENLNLEVKDSAGNLRAKHATFHFSTVSLDGREYQVLETQVVSYNENGTVKSKLMERYSVELSTAIEGVFLVPANDEATGWKAVKPSSS